MFVLRLPHISGDHYIIVGRNSLTSVLDKKDESLYKIPIIGLFGTSQNQNSLVSDVKHPEHAGLSDSCKRSMESHDFAMLILQARRPIVQILSSPRTRWKMLQLT